MARVFRTSSFHLAASGVWALVALASLTMTTHWAEASDGSEGNRPSFGTVIDLPEAVFSVAIDGDRIYVLRAWRFSGGWGMFVGSMLSIYDFANPMADAPLGSMTSYAIPTFAVEGGLAYFAGHSELRVVDVSDPANLQEVGTLTGWLDAPGCIAVGGGHAYVGDAAGLHVVDVTDPASPSLLGSVPLPSRAVSVALRGSFAYVGTLDARASVVDISDPNAPSVLGTVLLPGTPWDIEIRGSHAYVAGGESGLQVLDVSRAAMPQLVGTVDTPGEARGVAVSGARAYVADWAAWGNDALSGLRVIDIANPARPAIVNSVSKNVAAVAVNEGRIAVGGAIQVYLDCIASFPGGCPSSGYLEVARTSAYELAGRGASFGLGSSSLRGNAPAASQPAGFALTGTKPNPFNPATSIRFDVPRASQVRISAYDSRGLLVRTLVDDMLPPGQHEASWGGRNESGEAVASGVYFITMEAEGVRQTMKVTLLK